MVQNNDRKLKILFVSVEVSPFAKTGGLADVAGSLPQALAAMDNDVRIVMPRFKTINSKMKYAADFPVQIGDRKETCVVRETAIDVKTGQLLWSNEDENVMKLMEAAGIGLESTPGFRTMCMMLCTDKVIFLQAQTRANMVALSAEDGQLLWQREKKRNNPNFLFADGKLIQQYEKLDL